MSPRQIEETNAERKGSARSLVEHCWVPDGDIRICAIVRHNAYLAHASVPRHSANTSECASLIYASSDTRVAFESNYVRDPQRGTGRGWLAKSPNTNAAHRKRRSCRQNPQLIVLSKWQSIVQSTFIFYLIFLFTLFTVRYSAVFLCLLECRSLKSCFLYYCIQNRILHVCRMFTAAFKLLAALPHSNLMLSKALIICLFMYNVHNSFW